MNLQENSNLIFLLPAIEVKVKSSFWITQQITSELITQLDPNLR